jgi:hypothetical protein
MKRPEPMKNLWMISAPASGRQVTHSARLPNRGFVPICFMRQALDANGQSEVIPLRGVSY